MTDHDVHVPVDEPASTSPSTAAVAALARALFLHGRTTADPTAHAGVLRIRD